jgi:hypothetical protein
MAPAPKDPQAPSISVDVNKATTRYARYKRKKSSYAAWLLTGTITGLLLAMVGVAWWLSQDSSSLTIPAIADQEVFQGQTLWQEIPTPGYQPGQLNYNLGEAPPDATIDGTRGIVHWPVSETHPPGEYRITVTARISGQSQNAEQTFLVRVSKASPMPDTEPTDFSAGLTDRMVQANPFETDGELTPRNKIDELVFAKLKELEIQPSNPCSDGVFLRRAYFDVIGTLPTAAEARQFLESDAPDKRAKLVDELLERPEFADYLAMKWSDLLRVKAEFPINLWPNASQAYHHWIRTSIKENMPYDQFVRELLTSCGSNFRTPQVNFYRALQSKEPSAIAGAVALAFMGVRADKWPEERLAGMAVFFSQVGFKPTREWKEEIIVWDPRKAKADASESEEADALPPEPTFPNGVVCKLPPGKDPREVFADWLIDAKNPWFTRHIVNRVWYWLLGRGIVHEPDDIRPDNPAQNLELLNWLANELIQAEYDLKHIYRVILNSQTYQLSCIPKGDGEEAAANFACYSLRRMEAEVIIDAICQITGTTEWYESMIPEPFTFIPERHRSITLPDGSITSSVLETFGRPPRDSGLESERNNRFNAAQALHLINSTHILKKVREGPKIKELVESTESDVRGEAVYLTVLSRFPTEDELSQFGWQGNSRRGAEELIWALINTDEFLFRH